MKIFGKRKSKPADEGTDNASTATSSEQAAAVPTTAAAEAADNVNIPSYFSSDVNEPKKKKKPKKNPSNEINGEEMETLLKMDYEQLNSKQRRLVRRYKERSGDDVAAADAEKTVDADNSADVGSELVEKENKEANNVGTNETMQKTVEIKPSQSDKTEPDKSTAMNTDEKELLAKLEGLNSKQRRQFLRQLRNDNPNNIDIEKLEEEAKRIAERNIQDSKDTERQSQTPKKEEPKQVDSKPSSSNKKKKKPKDLSHLTPEEIARREKQRQMQIEAAERRARGEDLNHGHRHPLNSERRRANRRKPARKSQSNVRKEFNSVGYQMRKSG